MSATPAAGRCPRCRKAGTIHNFIVDDADIPPWAGHNDPESGGSFGVCHPCQVYWYLSSQYWDFEQLENEAVSRSTTRFFKATYQQVVPATDPDSEIATGTVIPFPNRPVLS